jgi:uncharacterized protein YkwD
MSPRHIIASAACLAALALSGGNAASAVAQSPSCPGQDVQPTARTLGTAAGATLCLVNHERSRRGLTSLKPVGSLTAAADAYARRMARDNFFDHTAPNGSTFITRIRSTSYLTGGVRSWSVGENIAWGTGTLATPKAIVASWMKSAGHRANILTPGFRELGLGIAVGAPRGGIADHTGATYVNEFGQRHR